MRLNRSCPSCAAAGMEELHSILIHAMGFHSAVVWRDDPQQQYLLSVLARYLGHRESEGNAWRSAFRLADPDEHDYLTLAQSYWQFLRENQRQRMPRGSFSTCIAARRGNNRGNQGNARQDLCGACSGANVN